MITDTTSNPPPKAIAAANNMLLSIVPVAILTSSSPIELAIASIPSGQLAVTSSDFSYMFAFARISFIA